MVGHRPKWRESYAQALSKADLVVCGDLDPAGQAHAAVIAETSARFAARLRVLDLAELARSTGLELVEKSGLDDWIDRRRQEGASRAEIAHQLTEWVATIDGYRPRANPPPAEGRQAGSGPAVVCMADVEPEEIRWLWYPRTPSRRRIGRARSSTMPIPAPGAWRRR